MHGWFILITPTCRDRFLRYVSLRSNWIITPEKEEDPKVAKFQIGHSKLPKEGRDEPEHEQRLRQKRGVQTPPWKRPKYVYYSGRDQNEGADGSDERLPYARGESPDSFWRYKGNHGCLFDPGGGSRLDRRQCLQLNFRW